VAVIALLLAWNVAAIVRNQHRLGPAGALRVQSRSLATVASQDPMETVRYTFATYYRLRVLAGATLVVPEWLAAHRFHLERVSRLRVEVVPERLALTAEAAERLAPEVDGWWSLDSGSPLAVIFGGAADPAGERYVMVERTGGGQFLILPETLFRQERARGPGQPRTDGTPGNPTEPGTPTEPGNPTNPGNPADPANPPNLVNPAGRAGSASDGGRRP
jgi:hypothetical protein